ncbi:MAG: FAD-binding oxidoreductase [Gammaproteobacteria bacterium]|nr:FAD-binding oxidoreductase [Gammaproteobacteria bacterium]
MESTSAHGLVEALEAIVGSAGYLADPNDMAPYLVDHRERYFGRSPVVVRPKSTAEVAAVVSHCARAGIAVVPQGGNTGLVGGAVPDESDKQIVLSLGRMKAVRRLDASNFTITVEAGVVLSEVQRHAQEAGLLFPLSLASEGSCQIGGNLSTNAGGTAVLRYGNARDLVLGLEVVLPTGEVWESLHGLRKDNTGYDLKQLFLGTEGTLGIITAATLKLFPRPTQVETALVAVPDPQAAINLLTRMRGNHGDAVTTFEYIHRSCLDLVFKHMDGARDPLSSAYEHYVLAEVGDMRGADLREAFEQTLSAAFDGGEALDAVLAESQAQGADLWRLRESIPEASKLDGVGMKHDISVTVSDIPEFLERGRNALRDAMPQGLIIAFGHVGDGNLHFNLNQTPDIEPKTFLANTERVADVIHDLAVEMNGSFSAEHGIGRSKRDALAKYKTPLEMKMMRAIKGALDPNNLLNPGKVV